LKIEKLLQSLVRPKAQRFQMVAGLVISMLILIPLYLQIQLEQSRTIFPELDAANLQYCELAGCEIAELGGLEVVQVEITEQKWATFVEVGFVNPGRLLGDRELYLELVNPNGEIAEAAKTRLVLTSKGQPTAIFSFQRTPEVLQTGSLRLVY
jgi:hypothetical protein